MKANMDLLIATSNEGKLREYQSIFALVPLRCLSLRDVGLADMDVEETGDTFLSNAELKARAYADASGLFALADDSGLAINALNGRPGIYSARYGGEHLTMHERRLKVLDEMKNVPDEGRQARFICVISVANPDQQEIQSVTGICQGKIAWEEDDGSEGFGYDCIFIPDGYTVANSRIPLAEKNLISHRGIAARKILPILEQLSHHNG
jgi:XTP/dITP diphosphohydrolase